MGDAVSAGGNARDLQPRNVSDLNRSIDGRIVVDIVSYVTGGSRTQPAGRVATVPRHIQCRDRLDSDITSFNTQGAQALRWLPLLKYMSRLVQPETEVPI